MLKMSKDSPFAHGTLWEDIGRYGETSAAEDILNSTYNMGACLLQRSDHEVLQCFIDAL